MATPMNEEVHISSLVVHVRPELRQAVADEISKVNGAEVHAVDPSGKIVCTFEAGDMGVVQNFMNRLAEMQGVLSSNLVYHHCEDSEALAEEIDYENHST